MLQARTKELQLRLQKAFNFAEEGMPETAFHSDSPLQDKSLQPSTCSNEDMAGETTSGSASSSSQTSEANCPILSVAEGEIEVEAHLELIRGTRNGRRYVDFAKIHEISTSPLFSSHVQAALRQRKGKKKVDLRPFSHYGLLGLRIASNGIDHMSEEAWDDGFSTLPTDNLVYNNVDAPSSTFICGSQGSGKSHTLSCMLENCLLSDSPAGTLPDPLAGIVFHYDNFTGHSSTQLCELAYLCSQGIPVRVLVSPSNIWTMKRLYTNLPGLPEDANKPQVLPLHFQEKQLNMSMMLTLMAVNSGSSNPLYLGVVNKILRDLAYERQGRAGLDYREFLRRLADIPFSPAQIDFLEMRLRRLESFLAFEEVSVNDQERSSLREIWRADAGTLTIVDLSCPFVSEGDACALFSICLDRFMENRNECGRIVALDEAHKFLKATEQAELFTDQLMSIICQQRHLATRIVIATQEPTLSPRLLDLCNLTIVHRFGSPEWYKILRSHIAGVRARSGSHSDKGDTILKEIVSLETGTALVFAPTAVLDIFEGEFQTLQDGYFKLKVRARITADGGKSIMATDRATEEPERPGSPPLLVKTFDRVPKKENETLGGAKKPSSKAKPSTSAAANPGPSTGKTSTSSTSKPVPQGPASSVPGTITPPDDLCECIEITIREKVWKSLRKDATSIKCKQIRDEARIYHSLPRIFYNENGRVEWATAVIKDQVARWQQYSKRPEPIYL